MKFSISTLGTLGFFLIWLTVGVNTSAQERSRTIPRVLVTYVQYTPPGCGAPPPPGMPVPVCPPETTVEFLVVAKEGCHKPEDFLLKLMPEGMKIIQRDGFQCSLGAHGQTSPIQLTVNENITVEKLVNPLIVRVLPRP